jgi:glyoxylase-like metal-dependent hydrolase (beta-lactamase superfamily II)/ferredoxin
MANLARKLPENVDGDFFVDETCIDCDACRQIAPATFGEGADYSYVREQPRSPADRRRTLQALLACPTGSIGCQGDDDFASVSEDFPLLIEDPVDYCGFNSPKSFGGNSYFIRRHEGNWLVDSPKFVGPLVRRLEQLGGVSHIFLTHRDDVADAAKYAAHFSATRIIDHREIASQPDAEIVLRGDDAVAVGRSLLAIPTPGHTAGHLCLLFDERFLFTGDHLAWSRDDERLVAWPDYCWYSWELQRESMKRLAKHTFEWVLPGHGQRHKLQSAQMREKLDELIARM